MWARSFTRAFGTAVITSLALPATLLAAAPEVIKVSNDDPEIEAADAAAISEDCGFAVDVDYRGGFNIHVFEGGRHVEVTNYHVRGTFTNPANGRTVRFVDSGPDRLWIDDDGHLVVAITGRSLTGSGTIGVLVVDTETGEILKESGRFEGNVYDDLCARLA